MTATSCAAPSINLYFRPNGDVGACCRREPFGQVGRDRLIDIWNGLNRRETIGRLALGRFEGSCSGCGDEIALEGRPSSYPATFDRFVPDGGASDALPWPLRMEFNLSDACNLQCIQCNGLLSSSIRIHREGGRPLANPYGDDFFEDLRLFIPHLESAQFAGGEPFLAAQSFRVWSLIEELNPGLDCTVVTNATKWNDSIERVVNALNMNFVFSLDGVTKEIYESIRVGADFDSVMANVDRLCDVAARRGTNTSINFCLLPQNYRGFGDVLMFAEERGMRVKVQVVRDSPIGFLMDDDPGSIGEALAVLESDDDRMLASLSLNAAAWTAELERLRSWASTPPDRLAEIVRNGWGPRVLEFPLFGTGPHDGAAVDEELRAAAGDTPLCTFDVNVHNVVTTVSESLCEVLGAPEADILGCSAELLERMTVDALGRPESVDVVRSDDDRRDIVVHYPRLRSETALIALRGADGRATGGRAYVTIVRTA